MLIIITSYGLKIKGLLDIVARDRKRDEIIMLGQLKKSNL